GGRLGFIVTNKWMKAGYGEPLRTLYGEAAWVESLVDVGHAKTFFPDADVFPCILIARRPTPDATPPAPRVCVIPRDQVRIDDLSRQIAEAGVVVPRDRFGPAAWNLEPPGVTALMDKLRRVGVPFKDFAGVSPLYGIKTGFNDAFLIDTATKEKLIAADPASAPLIRRYLRGQDIDRWHPEWAGLWMIAMKSSGNHPWPWAEAGDDAEAIFAKTYPALHAHMTQYREQLTKRQDQGEHWWELRACAYWDAFDRPKVMYQDIAWNPRYCLDSDGMMSNNSVYLLPTGDPWTLAALNAPISWWFAWRTAQHGKDEALRFFTDYLNQFPIPTPTDQQREAVTPLVAELKSLAVALLHGRTAVLDWLRHEFGVEKASQKLQAVGGLTADEMIGEVQKARGRSKKLTVADVKRLKEEHTTSVLPLARLAAEARGLEVRVSDLVNAAYGLTPADVALMWETAPPRTPLARGS
ncbi:MAG TPA: hypothetical protein VM597_11910, partial [Gemmataceae bacterium]|nr:hypothetical protein [Gemmataceae bacterium]